MDDIVSRPVTTRDFLNNSLQPQVRRQYAKLSSAAAFYNVSSAWDYLEDGMDTPTAQRACIAWLELSMYPKAVLCNPFNGGGKSKSEEAYA